MRSFLALCDLVEDVKNTLHSVNFSFSVIFFGLFLLTRGFFKMVSKMLEETYEGFKADPESRHKDRDFYLRTLNRYLINLLITMKRGRMLGLKTKSTRIGQLGLKSESEEDLRFSTSVDGALSSGPVRRNFQHRKTYLIFFSSVHLFLLSFSPNNPL